MTVAKKSIDMLSTFFFDTLGLESNLSKLRILEKDFSFMAKRACGGGIIKGFKSLEQKDVEEIFKMCL